MSRCIDLNTPSHLQVLSIELNASDTTSIKCRIKLDSTQTQMHPNSESCEVQQAALILCRQILTETIGNAQAYVARPNGEILYSTLQDTALRAQLEAWLSEIIRLLPESSVWVCQESLAVRWVSLILPANLDHFKLKVGIIFDVEDPLELGYEEKCQKLIEQNQPLLNLANRTDEVCRQVAEMKAARTIQEQALRIVGSRMREPLSEMKLALDLLNLYLQNASAIHPAIGHHLRAIEHNFEQLLDYSNHLLDLAQIQEMQTLKTTATALEDWIYNLAQPFKIIAKEHQQNFELTLTPLPRIENNLIYLKKILEELLMNACKFTTCGGDITLKVTRTDQNLDIEVVNSCLDLRPEEIGSIGKIFYRVSRMDHWNRGGLGLGVYLTRQICVDLGYLFKTSFSNQVFCARVSIPMRSIKA